MIRSPLLEADALVATAGPAEYQSRIDELFAFAARTPICEALATSSASIVDAIAAPHARTGAREAIAMATMRYVARMRGRATPFGLCAGYALLPVAASSEVAPYFELAPRPTYEAVLRIDVDAITSAMRAAFVDARPARNAVAWVANSELARLGGTAKVFRRAGDGSVSWAEIVQSEALEVVLAYAGTPRGLDELAERLTAFADDVASRLAYCHQLIDVGLLIPSAYPSVSTDRELDALRKLPAFAALADQLERGRRAPIDRQLLRLGALAEAALGARAIAAHESQAAAVDEEAHDLPTGKRTACIYDLTKRVQHGVLPTSYLREIARVYTVLQRLHVDSEDTRHVKFRQFLSARYESRLVPLSEALDPEYGFYFPPHAEYLDVPTPLDEWRLRLLSKALMRGEREIILREVDLPSEAIKAAPPAVGFALLCQLRATATGLKMVQPSFSGPPGTLFFGRASGVIAELRDLTRSFVAAQAALLPDVDLAQLTYFVPGRSASFVQYPTLTPYELTFAARPGLDTAHSLPVDDVLVGISAGKISLYSRITGREIMLVSTGAANPNRPDVSPIARFLLTLPSSSAAAEFSWGKLAAAPFLPRITFDGHVLAAASWNLDKTTTESLRKRPTSVEERFRAVQQLRDDLGLPRHVLFSERADLLLPVDLEDVLSIESWLDIATERMTLTERVIQSDSAVRGPEGPFHHELAIPLLIEKNPTARPVIVAPLRSYDESATFDRMLPGGDCLFLAVYGVPSGLISVLTESLRELVVDGIETGQLTHWFFLPYSDPEAHLRLRFFGSPAFLWGVLLPRIHQKLAERIACRAIRHVAALTYERESVRYGGIKMMDLCERVFWASSEAAVAFFDEFAGDQALLNDMLVPVVHSQHALLASSGLDAASRRAQARQAAEWYTHTADRAVPLRAAAAFLRAHGELLGAPPPAEGLWGAEVANRFAASLDAVKQACDAGKSTLPYAAILTDIMHVHTIRMITTWCEIPNLEAIAYCTLEKWMSRQQFRGAAG